jgi:hypothetical protein
VAPTELYALNHQLSHFLLLNSYFILSSVSAIRHFMPSPEDRAREKIDKLWPLMDELNLTLAA